MVCLRGSAQDENLSLDVQRRLGLPSLDERVIGDEGCRSNSKSELVVSGTGVGVGSFVVFSVAVFAEGVKAPESRRAWYLLALGAVK